MNDENQGEKKEGRPRRRFPRRRRSGGNAEGGGSTQGTQSQGNQSQGTEQGQGAAEPRSGNSGGDGGPRNSRPPRRPSRAPESAAKSPEQAGRENAGGGGSRSRSNRRRRGERRPTDGTQAAQPPASGQRRDDENRASRNSRPPVSGNRAQDNSSAAGRPGTRNQQPGRREDARPQQGGAGRRDARGRGGPRNEGRPRSDEGNLGRPGASDLPNYGRGADRRDFRDPLTKKDSMLPEPFLREEAYSEALENETAGYEEMTEDQLTFLKTTIVGDGDYDEGEADFVIPENAVLMDVAGVKLHHADPMLMFDSKDLHLAVGDRVVVETKKGLALGSVLRETRRCFVKQHNLPRVIRKMSQGDVRQEERNKEKEEAALQMCKERIDRLRLPMKLIEVEYLHGGNKAVFYFAAEGRVDFRELVRDLAQRLHTRIEMRQIGVRDVARIVGGIGICGCQLCCNLYLREFKPISIRMAKDQNLVLNPQKVSGVCGRLLCCLTYENEVYQKAAQSMPRVGRRVFTPDGEGRIRDRDVLKRTVRVQLNEESQFRDYHVDELEFASGRSQEGSEVESETDAQNELNDDRRDASELSDDDNADSQDASSDSSDDEPLPSS